MRRLLTLHSLVAPRVSAAALSTLWNRWTSARRFQREASCVLGCREQADSIEHYVRCPVVRSFAGSFIQMQIPAALAMQYFMLADDSLEEPQNLTRMGIVIYAVYRATEHIRRSCPAEPVVVQQMLQQFAREAVKGHSPSMRVLDGAPRMLGRGHHR